MAPSTAGPRRRCVLPDRADLGQDLDPLCVVAQPPDPRRPEPDRPPAKRRAAFPRKWRVSMSTPTRSPSPVDDAPVVARRPPTPRLPAVHPLSAVRVPFRIPDGLVGKAQILRPAKGVRGQQRASTEVGAGEVGDSKDGRSADRVTAHGSLGGWGSPSSCPTRSIDASRAPSVTSVATNPSTSSGDTTTCTRRVRPARSAATGQVGLHGTPVLPVSAHLVARHADAEEPDARGPLQRRHHPRAIQGDPAGSPEGADPELACIHIEPQAERRADEQQGKADREQQGAHPAQGPPRRGRAGIQGLEDAGRPTADGLGEPICIGGRQHDGSGDVLTREHDGRIDAARREPGVPRRIAGPSALAQTRNAGPLPPVRISHRNRLHRIDGRPWKGTPKVDETQSRIHMQGLRRDAVAEFRLRQHDGRGERCSTDDQTVSSQ